MLFVSLIFLYFRGCVSALGTLKERKCAEYQQDTAHFFIFGATLVQQFGFLVVKLPFLQ